MDQPSAPSKGKEPVAPSAQEDNGNDLVERLSRQRAQQMFRPSLNMELGESSSSRIHTTNHNISASITPIRLPPRGRRATRGFTRVVLPPSRRALGQQRRRLQASLQPNPTIMQPRTTGEEHDPEEEHNQNETVIPQQNSAPHSLNIVLPHSRRVLGQKRRRLEASQQNTTTLEETQTNDEEHDERGDFEHDEFHLAAIDNQQLLNESRHFLGRMDIICEYCTAMHYWIDERLVRSSKSRPKFGTCCSEGQIRLPPLRDPPTIFRALYDGTDIRSTSFLQHIQQYNAAHAFTSLGCTIDRSVLIGRGPYSFTIHGELRHRTGALVPQPDTHYNKNRF